MHAAWQQLKMDTRNAKLRRAVKKACSWLKRVPGAAYFRFFEYDVVELGKNGFFLNIKSVQLEETKKVE